MEVTKGFGIIGSLTPHVRQYRKRGTWGNHFLPVIEMFLIQWSSGKFVRKQSSHRKAASPLSFTSIPSYR